MVIHHRSGSSTPFWIHYSFSFGACIFDILGDSPLLTNIHYVALLTALALIPIITIVVCNIWIACIARKQVTEVYKRCTFGTEEEKREYDQKILKLRNKKQLALMRVFGAVLIGNLIVWIPPTVLVVASLSMDSSLVPLGFYTAAYVTFLMHTVLPPLSKPVSFQK